MLSMGLGEWEKSKLFHFCFLKTPVDPSILFLFISIIFWFRPNIVKNNFPTVDSVPAVLLKRLLKAIHDQDTIICRSTSRNNSFLIMTILSQNDFNGAKQGENDKRLNIDVYSFP